MKCTPSKGTLTINKISIGGTGAFAIDADLNGAITDFDITTQTDGVAEPLSQNVAPGSYTISETPPAGWILESIQCGTGPAGQTATAIVSANATTTCTVTNKKKASVTINKQTIDGFGAFGFEATTKPAGQSNIQFTQSTAAPNTTSVGEQLTDLVSGTYTFTETPPAGAWSLTDLTCDTGTGITSASINGSTGTFTLAPGATGTCTFTNTLQQPRTGTIIIEKIASGGDGATAFGFTTAGTGLSAFSLTPPANGPAPIPKTFSNLTPGPGYTVTETPVAGWTTSVSCDDPTSNTSFAGNNATIDVAADETVTCTFTNTRDKADLTIMKETIGGTGSFNFSVSGQGSFPLSGGGSNTLSLPTDTYTITETNLPAGWTLQSISACGSVDLANKSVTVDLTTGSKTCTFTNFKEKDDTTEDETERFIHRRVDNLLTYGPDRARMLRRLQEQPPQQSLKDGPLKFSGGAAVGAGPMTVGRSPMGLTSGSLPGMSLGASSAALGMGTSGLAYTGPFKYDGVTYFENEGDDIAPPFERRASSSLFGELASQLMPLASGDTSFKFGTSLGEIRAAAATAKAEKERAKLEQAGLGFADQPYTDRFATLRQGFDVWVEGHIAKYDDDIGGINREGDFRILYVGADYVVAPGVLIGALVQIDDTEEDIDDPSLTGKIEGTGWMAGPYIGIRITDNLFFDARAAWGQSDNDIALNDPVVGARTGSFDTDRWLASASLTGNEYFGPWRLSPQLQVAYGNEESDTYTTSLGQSVSSTEATIGRLTGTMEVGYRVQQVDGTIIEPHIAISGIWNFDTDDLTFNGVTYGTDEARAKVEGGILIHTPTGLGLRAAGSYDGLGADDYEAYSGSLWVNIPLN